VSGFLFDNIVFGPVYSRRLGVSLGINLLPVDNKFCNFNCIYCECGWTEKPKKKIVLAKREELKSRLEKKLKEIQGTVNEPDAITFAGNGEPTTHPEFAEIIDDTIELRNKYAPQKLDSGIEGTFDAINQAQGNITLPKIIDGLLAFEGKLIIQTLFMRGEYKGKLIDNTTDEEVEAWLEIVKKVKPEYVMLYPIERGTPAKNLEKVSKEKLDEIAAKVEAAGIKAEVYS